MFIEKIGYDYKIGCYTLSHEKKSFINLNGSVKKSPVPKYREEEACDRDSTEYWHKNETLQFFKVWFLGGGENLEDRGRIFTLFERFYSLGVSEEGMYYLLACTTSTDRSLMLDNWKITAQIISDNSIEYSDMLHRLRRMLKLKKFEKYLSEIPENYKIAFTNFFLSNYTIVENSEEAIRMTAKILNELEPYEAPIFLFNSLTEEDIMYNVVRKVQSALTEAKEINYNFTSGNLTKQIYYVHKAYIEHKNAKESIVFAEYMSRVNWENINEVFSKYKVVIPNGLKDCQKIGSDFSNCAGGYEWNNYLSKGSRGLVAFYDEDSFPIACVDFIVDTARIPQALAPHNNRSQKATEIGEILADYISKNRK